MAENKTRPLTLSIRDLKYFMSTGRFSIDQEGRLNLPISYLTDLRLPIGIIDLLPGVIKRASVVYEKNNTFRWSSTSAQAYCFAFLMSRHLRHNMFRDALKIVYSQNVTAIASVFVGSAYLHVMAKVAGDYDVSDQSIQSRVDAIDYYLSIASGTNYLDFTPIVIAACKLEDVMYQHFTHVEYKATRLSRPRHLT